VGQQFVTPVEIAGRVDSATGVIIPLAVGESREGEGVIKGVRYDKARRETPQAVYSLSRTIGVWVAAILTLCVFSYLYRDNPFYKLVESIIVGVSAGYWIVQYGWTVLVSKVLVKLSPDLARYAFLPETPVDAKPEYLYLIPVILGCLIFLSADPQGSVARSLAIGVHRGDNRWSQVDSVSQCRLRATDPQHDPAAGCLFDQCLGGK